MERKPAGAGGKPLSALMVVLPGRVMDEKVSDADMPLVASATLTLTPLPTCVLKLSSAGPIQAELFTGFGSVWLALAWNCCDAQPPEGGLVTIVTLAFAPKASAPREQVTTDPKELQEPWLGVALTST